MWKNNYSTFLSTNMKKSRKVCAVIFIDMSK